MMKMHEASPRNWELHSGKNCKLQIPLQIPHAAYLECNRVAICPIQYPILDRNGLICSARRTWLQIKGVAIAAEFFLRDPASRTGTDDLLLQGIDSSLSRGDASHWTLVEVPLAERAIKEGSFWHNILIL
jgi:hypothetical protein